MAEEKAKITFYLPADLVRRVKHCVANLAGAPEFLSLTVFGIAALEAEVEKYEGKYNEGKPFPPGRVRTGRPPKE